MSAQDFRAIAIALLALIAMNTCRACACNHRAAAEPGDRPAAAYS